MTKHDILQRTNGGLNIYRHILGEIPERGKCMRNPFRDDRKPSFNVYQGDTCWRHHDFADPTYCGDAFDMAALHYGLNTNTEWRQLLECIGRDMLGEVEAQSVQRPVVIQPQTVFFAQAEVKDSLGPSLFTHNVLRYANEEQALEVFQAYNLGHVDNDRTQFWYTNAKGQHCASKVTTYRYDGDRLTKKDKKGRGTTYYAKPPGVKRLTLDLFGAHLINAQPGKTVVVVEAEDTAVTCAAVWGNEFIWTAAGGTLSLGQTLCCKGRDVLVMPDYDVLNDVRKLRGLNSTIEAMQANGIRAKLWPLLDQLHDLTEGVIPDERRAKMDARDYIEAMPSNEDLNG